MPDGIPPIGAILPIESTPPLGYYFQVIFLFGGYIPNPIDTRLQRVSGLRASMSPVTHEEGGQNLYSHRLPNRIGYDNLVLERGLMTFPSVLNLEFQEAMSWFKFNTGNVLVMLMNEDTIPVSSWLFFKTYPVSWSTSDLNANENQVVIDTLELAYQRFQRISL